MKNIKLTYTSSEGDCECCGSYYHDTLRVELDGVEKVTLTENDHMGPAELYNAEDAIQRVLEALGYKVELERVRA